MTGRSLIVLKRWRYLFVAPLLVLPAACSDGSVPDAFGKGYPVVSPLAEPSSAKWVPSGRTTGPLPPFKGRRSQVAGRIAHKASGLSYARFGSPWRRFSSKDKKFIGQEFGKKKKGASWADRSKAWFVAVSSRQASLTGKDAEAFQRAADKPRAAAELTAARNTTLNPAGTRITELAGASLTVDGHKAWVTALRLRYPPGAAQARGGRETHITIAVDTGRELPGVVRIQVPGNKERYLPDATKIIKSLRVLR